MSLKGFYKTDVVTVTPETPVREAAEIMQHRHVGDVVVVQEKGGKKKAVGMLTDRDITIGCVAKGFQNIDALRRLSVFFSGFRRVLKVELLHFTPIVAE